MPKALQPLSGSLFYYLPRKEVFKDRFNRSIVIYSIISNKVSNIRP